MLWLIYVSGKELSCPMQAAPEMFSHRHLVGSGAVLVCLTWIMCTAPARGHVGVNPPTASPLGFMLASTATICLFFLR